MSQTGYTPIQLYRTSTASAVPTAGNLAAGELAINLTDEKLYFKNAGGTVTLLASSAGASGTVTSVALSGGTTGLTVSGSPITSSGTITIGGTLAVANGGTGVTTSTGSGSVVLSTSPTLTTPVLGVASATSIATGLGLVGTPAHTFTGDLDTGMWSPGANTIAFSGNGTEAMRIDSSGNIGIGTSSPSNGRLNVQAGTASTGNSAFFNNVDGTYNPYLQIQHSSAGVKLFNSSSFGGSSNNLIFGNGGTAETMRIDGSGNVGIGVTPSAWWSGIKALQVGVRGAVLSSTTTATLSYNSFFDGTNFKYIATDFAVEYRQSNNNGSHAWFIAPSGTAGANITFTQAMTLDASGNLGVGTAAPAARLHAVNSGLAGQLRLQDVTTDATAKNGVMGGAHYTNAQAPVLGMWISSTSTSNVVYVGGGLGALNAATSIQFFTAGSNTTATGTLQAAITSAGYLEATYSDKVVALGNSGTATTINLAQGNVFTATLTGNCTFTLSGSNANSSRGSSFTLILTNDGTAGRTVAWAGGNFRFPGGAASLSRTTTANAVDIWVFFTPDQGTTWYGNISMKNMTA